MNLREKYNALLQEADELLAKANKAVESDEFEQAEQYNTEYDEVVRKADAVKEQIKRMEKAEEGRKSANRLPFETTDDDPEASTEPDSFNKSIYVLQYGETNDAIKAVATEIWGKDYNEKRAKQRRNFEKYLRLGETRMSHDERASLDELIYTPDVIESEVKAGYTVQEIRSNKVDQQESVLQLGGALVPEDSRMDIVQRLEGPTSVRGRARVINTARDAVEFPKLEGGDSRYISGVRVTWADAEIPGSSTFAQTNFEMGTIKIPVHVVMARTDLSLNLLEDAGIDVVSYLGEQFASAQRVDENEQFLTGTGGGRPRGILGKRSGAEKTPEDGVSAVNSGDASAVTADGLIDLVYELDAQYLAQNPVFIGNKQTFRQIRKLKDGQGDYLWSAGLERGAPPMVLGYDYYMDEAMPDISANGYPLIFGDLMAYYIVERVGMAIERVRDTTTVGRNKAAIFMRRRLGGQLVEPWRVAAQKISA